MKFDLLKLKMPDSIFTNLDLTRFESITKDGRIVRYQYRQTEPYLLNITIIQTLKEKCAIVEFSGKILEENYPMLIHSGTIAECLSKINETKLCRMNVEKAIAASEVLKCDVTADIPSPFVKSIKELAMNTTLTNNDKWTIKNFQHGFILEKTVETPYLKRRLTIYDKHFEFTQKSKNFHDHIANKRDQSKYFQNILRYELNIKSLRQMRILLEIQNNKLTSVLSSTADPIMKVLNDACATPIYQYHATTLKEYKNEVFLCYHDNDLRKVEAAIRKYANANTSITRLMEPYRQLYNSTLSATAPDIKRVYWTGAISPTWLPYSPNSPLIL